MLLTPPFQYPIFFFYSIFIIMAFSSQHSTLNPNAESFHFNPRRRLSSVLIPQIPTLSAGAGFRRRGDESAKTRKRGSAKTEWRVKQKNGNELQESSCDNGNGNRRPVIPFPNTVTGAERFLTTTVMIRNIPNQFKFDDLVHILDKHCLQQNKEAVDPSDWSKFDFVYLPMDYRKYAIEGRYSNLGYAFVNFSTPSAALKFYQRFHGHKWKVLENSKICEINAAHFQGKEMLVRVFEQKKFRCTSPDFLPMVYSEGRDGMNRQVDGTRVGKHVWGLPRASI